MHGVFEQAVICTSLDIKALVINFDFKPLFSWLDEHDQRPPFTRPGRFARALHIRVTCRPELSFGPWFDESSPRFSTLGDSWKKHRVQQLLLQNVMATMTGWSWQLTMYFSKFPMTHPASPHETTKFPFFHANPRCRRIKSGYHYDVAIIADDTWRCLDDTTSARSVLAIHQNKHPVPNTNSSSANFYPKMYDTLACGGNMRTDVDRKLALVLRKVCQSRCSRSERDAVAACTDLSHLYVSFQTPDKLYWKWVCIIFDRAAKELSHLEEILRVQKQKRHERLMAEKVEEAVEEAEAKQKRHELSMADEVESTAKDAKDKHEIARRSDKKLWIEHSGLALQQRASRSGLEPGGTEDVYGELIKMMSRWHL
jgi:hypothetical protein